MSIQSDVAAVFQEVETTCPVLYAGQAVRGLLDRSQASGGSSGGTDFTVASVVLRLLTGALPELASDAQIIVGSLGDASAAGGEEFTVVDILREDDGAVSAVVLVEGAP